MNAGTVESLDESIAEYHRQQEWLLTLIADPEGRRYLQPRDLAADFAAHSQRMQSFLSHSGRPQDRFRSVHVAGTSGKGSVSTLCAALLTACGQCTALHTSPYLQITNEKLRLDGEMITPSEFVLLVRRFRRLYESWAGRENELKYDQAWAALTFLWMARQCPDWGVVEVGVGGRYDPTNVLESALAIITNVELDHVDVLGNTLTEVAHHKAGIIKPGGRTVTAATDHDVLAVIDSEAKKKGAKVRSVKHEVGEDGLLNVHTPDQSYVGIEVPLKGGFQQINAATAITAVDWLARDFGFDFPREVIEPAMAAIRFPGRFEILQEDPTVVLDGAHNPHKMGSLADSFGSEFPGRKAAVIMGMIGGKSIEATIAPLLSIAREFVLADFQVLGKPSASSEELQSALAGLCPEMPSVTETSVEDALDRWLDPGRNVDAALITGSLYFIGLARERWHPREAMLRDLEAQSGRSL